MSHDIATRIVRAKYDPNMCTNQFMPVQAFVLVSVSELGTGVRTFFSHALHHASMLSLPIAAVIIA